MPKLSPSRAWALAALVVTTLVAGRARAEGPVEAADPPPSARAMREAVRSYYDSEMTSAYLFVGYGAVTAAAGGVTLTQGGDFARGFGLSSLVLGGVTALGGSWRCKRRDPGESGV